MKRDKPKKLSLSRTTIRNLSLPDLKRVAGGQTIWTCSELCTIPAACTDTDGHWCDLDTQFVHGCAG